MLALFLFLERVGGSHRVAGIGIAVYACNPSFLYFDSQFGYESLALAIAGAYAARRAALEPGLSRTRPRGRRRLTCWSPWRCCPAGMVITHHLTTYAMIAFLALWTAAIWILRGRGPAEQLLVPFPKETHRQPRLSIVKTVSTRVRVGPALGCLLLGAVGLCWFAFVAGDATQDELGSVFANAISALFHLVFGGGGTKTLFKAGTGQVDPLVDGCSASPRSECSPWSSRSASGGSGAIAAPAPWPFRSRPSACSTRSPSCRGSPLPARRSPSAPRSSSSSASALSPRSSLLHLTESLGRQRSRLLALLATGLTGLVFVGGLILGESPVTRQPGRFEVGAESRSISPQGVAAARFAYEHLPHDSRILVDGPNGLLLGSYGDLDPVIGSIRGIPITEVFFSKKFNRDDRIVISP